MRPVLGSPPPMTGFPKTPSPVSFLASPSRMTWRSGDQTIAEATYQNPRVLRIRGTVPMSFSTEGSLDVNHWRCWLFRVPPTSKESLPTIEFTTTPDTALRFLALNGDFTLINDAPYDFNFKDNNRRLTISAKPGETSWEVAIIDREIDTNDTVYEGTPNGSFDDSAESMANAFDEYVEGMCGWGATALSSVTAADRLGSYVMWTSTVRPAGFLGAEAVLMSKLWMNKLWSWDNCINGLALVQFSIDLALNQILLPFQRITPEGRLPDSMSRNEILFDYTKPPIYGWTFFKALQLLNPKSSEAEPIFTSLSESRLVEIHDRVSLFTDFWFVHRKTNASVLPYYSHGNDSGWDNSTAYDYQTVCVSPDLAAFLVVQCDFLAKLAAHLGRSSLKWSELRDRTRQGLIEELWNEQEGAFMFKDAFNGSTWTSTTLLQFLPIIAASHLPETIVDRMVNNLDPYLSEWGLATEKLDSKLYEPDGYWRGPIWAPPTLMLEAGLRAADQHQLADVVCERYIRLCENNGFAENYNARTGEGNRDLSYTWAASAYLVLRSEQEARKASAV
ncbi:hypothetical protein I302_107219 [Kwoniella bestiolae CBS 10118]|uniref:Mannosylglycerate hydrolase MGH1-like glycoside hydrolase domain-containing protein n=1 Tax=Kwoniella bestiolae CBS 10118 TaxID=1296100 RepID=A0A1B9FZ74_9TREE|nr:hypothetical protein I302_07046 [Kwoniella bestiolae CBS 10118]OCF24060.1 hypothetical protein I302_07046 [Kwoniella bestiolae CBS 10118]